jgi:hypothetical protein
MGAFAGAGSRAGAREGGRGDPALPDSLAPETP